MKKLLIAAAVASLVLFFWQFASWSGLGIHDSQMAHTDKQEAVLEALATIGLEEGDYMMPRLATSATMEQADAYGKEITGKPWVRIMYHKAWGTNMGLNMFRGWIINFISAFLLAWILAKIPGLTMQTALISSLSVGLIAWMTISYQESVWFETNAIPQLIDAIVQWGIVGAWMGWYLPRNSTT